MFRRLEGRVLGLNLCVDLCPDKLVDDLQIAMLLTFLKDGGTATPGEPRSRALVRSECVGTYI